MPWFAPHGAPSTVKAWRDFAAAVDAQSVATLPHLARAFPHQVVETQFAGVIVREVTPAGFDPGRRGLLIHFHGGGYVLGGGEASLPEAILAAHHTGLKVLCVDYRLTPDYPFPAALDDALSVYRAVIAAHDPALVGVLGTSAGANLALSLLLSARANGLPFPGALALGTPWADLTFAGDSYSVNAGVDGVLTAMAGVDLAMARLYAGDVPLSNALVSPVHGDFDGFPPTQLFAGTRDGLLSDTVRVHRAMRRAGVDARLEVYEALSHGEYLLAIDSPEALDLFQTMASFFSGHLQEPGC